MIMTKQRTRNKATTSKLKREFGINGNSNRKTTREHANKSNYNRVAYKKKPPSEKNKSDLETETQILKMKFKAR